MIWTWFMTFIALSCTFILLNLWLADLVSAIFNRENAFSNPANENTKGKLKLILSIIMGFAYAFLI